MSGPYSLRRPCPECPFLRDGPGLNPVRLTADRIRHIAGNMLAVSGSGEFHCHKTTGLWDDRDDDDACVEPAKDALHCAGALIFAEKNETSTQMMRIAERLGMYDPRDLDSDAFGLVFDDMDEMLETAWDRRARRWRPRKRQRRSKR